MEKYYIKVDGVKKEAPNPIKVTISNPTKEQYKMFGYDVKTCREEEKPEYNPETQYLEEKEIETDTEFIITYEVKEIAELEAQMLEEGENIE